MNTIIRSPRINNGSAGDVPVFRCFVIVLLFVMPVVVSAQSDQAFVIDAEDLAHPLTIKTLNRTGRYQAKVSRQFGNEMEERLLQIAEAVYPLSTKSKIFQTTIVRLSGPTNAGGGAIQLIKSESLMPSQKVRSVILWKSGKSFEKTSPESRSGKK